MVGRAIELSPARVNSLMHICTMIQREYAKWTLNKPSVTELRNGDS